MWNYLSPLHIVDSIFSSVVHLKKYELMDFLFIHSRHFNKRFWKAEYQRLFESIEHDIFETGITQRQVNKFVVTSLTRTVYADLFTEWKM